MQRILQRTSATLKWSPVDSDGEPSSVDPGVVTVTVTNSAGTVLHADAATSPDGAARQYTLSAVDTASLDVLSAVWKVGSVVVGETRAAIVGGYYFTLTELRDDQPVLSDPTAHSDEDLIKYRAEVESSFESWTNMAWVPRLTVATLTSPVVDLFAVRSVRWATRHHYDTATALTADELANILPASFGYLNGLCWYGNYITAGIEHGQDAPPLDLKRAAMRWCRRLATRKESGLSDRAQSYTTPEGMTVNVGRVGTEWRPTGDEIIDEVLRRPDIDHRVPGIA